MKYVVLSVMLLASASGWSAGEAPGEDSVSTEVRESVAMALERLAEARTAFEDALAGVESIEFHEVFDNGAMLGVVIRDDEDAGVHVVGVTPDSGAEAAGILVDDVIVAVDGKDLAGKAHPSRMLRKAMDAVEPGDTVRIVLIRGGDEHSVGVEAMRRPHPKGPFHWRNGHGDFSIFPGAEKRVRVFHDRARVAAHGDGGLKLLDIGEDLGGYFGVDAGVLVLDVPPGSALKPGDIVRRINDADIGNADEAYLLLSGLDEAGEATVRRENRVRTVQVEPLEGRFARAFKIMVDRTDEGQAEENVDVEIEVE